MNRYGIEPFEPRDELWTNTSTAGPAWACSLVAVAHPKKSESAYFFEGFPGAECFKSHWALRVERPKNCWTLFKWDGCCEKVGLTLVSVLAFSSSHSFITSEIRVRKGSS